MVDPPDDLLVTMAEMEASILDFLMVSLAIVSSSADFSRLFFSFFSIRTTPVTGLRAIAIAVSCIARSADIFRARFDHITEPFFSGYVP